MTSWSSIEEDSKRYHQNFLLCNNYRMHCRFIQQFPWRSVRGCIFQGNAATNYRWSIQLRVCGQIIYVCNSERIILESDTDSICKSYAQRKKGPVFWLIGLRAHRCACNSYVQFNAFSILPGLRFFFCILDSWNWLTTAHRLTHKFTSAYRDVSWTTYTT